MKKILIAVLLVFCFVPVVHAAIITDTFYLTVNNAGFTGGPWGTITLSQNTANTHRIDISVDPTNGAFASTSSSFGMRSFSLNTNAGGTLSVNDLPFLWWASYNQSLNPYGTFSIKASDAFYLNPEDPLSFNITSTQDISLANFERANLAGYLFGGSISGFTVDGSNRTSAVFATPAATSQSPVPEPGTMLLLGSGLVGLAGWGRKKFHK